MPWPIAVLLLAGAVTLVAKAVIDGKARYDEPANALDDRFDHMIEPTAQRDRELQNRRR